MRNVGHLFETIMVVAVVATTAAAAPPTAPAGALAPSESARMLRAKDLISDDQWLPAIVELRAAVADPKEQNRDEALFWLAHSQNQAGDLAEAVESLRRLQREFGRSRWSKPAYSLLIELAQKLGRKDVLWRMAPPPPPAPPAATTPLPPRSRGRARPTPLPPAPPAAFPSPAPVDVPPPPPPAAPTPWVAETYLPDGDLRLQALSLLIHTDAQKVIPMLGHMAFESSNLMVARRAVFVLAQSRNPEAQSMVVNVAKRGPEQVRVAAVRELGRFGGPEISDELLQVYVTAKLPVKQQVVKSLGERADAKALLKIAQSESDRYLRDTAIVTLGRAGARDQLRVMYVNASTETREAVIRGLFNARDDDGLIRIAEQEKDPSLRREVLARLRLMGTPKARTYLETLSK
jgi:HEAT repeat protein